ncbi:MAG: hypothetical protein HS113_18235 [Verrucomicrobiales bacterium]|nr:hypothetical protein [Verrucomicrobiales bacterium]
MLFVRLAEKERPFLSDESKVHWYKKALDNNPTSLPALAGISLFGLGQTNAQRWIDLWLRHDASNALPYFTLALSEELYLANREASLTAIADGNMLGTANFRPLFAELDEAQRAGWARNIWEQAYAEYGTAHVSLSGRFEAMARKLFSGDDQRQNDERRLLAGSVARMYDLLACSEAFCKVKMLRFMPLSIRALESSVSGEPSAPEQMSMDVNRLVGQRRSLLADVRTAEGVPDRVLGDQLKGAVRAVRDASPTKVFDRAADRQ